MPPYLVFIIFQFLLRFDFVQQNNSDNWQTLENILCFRLKEYEIITGY